MKKIKWTDLIILIVSAELVGALAGCLAGNSFSFYKELAKPPLSPPGWIFPVTWTILYALMGISAYIIHASDAEDNEKRSAFIIYGAQLAVNFFWTIAFFRLRSLGLSVGVILLLLVLIVAMLLRFRKVSPAAAYLNIPYLLWTLFATYLDIGVLVLNR